METISPLASPMLWHPHRDTWYSAPQCQLNWWIPIYDIESENAMAFHPRYWSEPVRNDSNGYNYYQWNQTPPLECSPASQAG